MALHSAMASRREVWGWGLYDFANSPFATTIMAVIFNRYFVRVLVGDDGVTLPIFGRSVDVPGVTFFTFTLAMAMLIVAVTAPVLGAIADFTGSKKKFLAFFCYMGAGATALLSFAHEGQYWRGAIFFVIAQIGFAAGNVFYNAFLPEISTRDNIGWVSGFGFMLGYLGGSLLLGINLLMLSYPEWLGFSEPFTPNDTFLTVAVWWAVFAIPTLLWVRERKPATNLPAGKGYLALGFRRLGKTLRNLRSYSELTKFLIAFLVYNDGIQTVIVVAAIFVDQVVGMSDGQVVALFLVIQATAFVGSLLLGSISDRIGNKQTIVITLLLWIVVAVWGYFIGFTGNAQREVWMMGLLVGLILGGSQAASRALQGMFTPEEKSAEFFSFFGIAGRFSSVVGPLVYGSTYALLGIRFAILSLALFFIVGLAILLAVDEQKGVAQAKAAVA